MIFDTGCSLGKLRVNLWLSGPGKNSPFSDHCYSTSGAGGQVVECGKFSFCYECFRGADTVGLLLWFCFFFYIKCKIFEKDWVGR